MTTKTSNKTSNKNSNQDSGKPKPKAKKVNSKNSRANSKKDGGISARSLLDKVLNLKSGNNLNSAQIIAGLAIFGLAIYIGFIMISYVIDGKIDQSSTSTEITVVSNPTVNTLDGSKTENPGSIIGVKISDFLINKLFGLSSFILIYIMALVGASCWGETKGLFKKIARNIAVMIWLSIVLGYITAPFTKHFHIMPGGAYGLYISNWMNGYIGWLGSLIIITVITLSILIIRFDGFGNKMVSSSKKVASGVKNRGKNGSKLSPEEREELDSESDDNAYDDDDYSETPNRGVTEEVEIKKDYSREAIDESPIIKREIVEEREVDTVETPVHIDIVPERVGNIEERVEPTNRVDDENRTDRRALNIDVDGKAAPTLIVEKLQETETVDKLEHSKQENYDPTLDLSKYQFPTLELLQEFPNSGNPVSDEELQKNTETIIRTLRNYSIEIISIKATSGPTVTLYEIIPAPGIRVNKIKNLEDDIALSLSALGIRIIAPIPGKGTIGIEVPNMKPKMVPMKDIISSKEFSKTKYELPLALGKTISNEPFIIDLAKMPHILIAGATGQGKSVGINAVIASLLYKKHPSQLKFVFIDPKKVELSLYSVIERHFLAKMPDEEEPIITDVQKVKNTLNSVCIEMDQRYDLLKNAGARNVLEYNKKFIERRLNPENGHRHMPYIVVVIDEFADLIMTAGKEIETPIARIAQLARAVGIHMIIATQRPSANIITGPIKANFPARIAFKVASMIDSRTIMDSPGANQLVGKGDMLVKTGNEMTRVQCAFIDTPEVEAIANFIGEQRGYPTALLLPEYVEEGGEANDTVDLSNRDVMFEEAARHVVINQSGSTSAIQRRFSVGYNRAGRIMDQLEFAGIVAAGSGSKPREVLVSTDFELDTLLKNL